MTGQRRRLYTRLSLLSAGSALVAAWIMLMAYFWHFERGETLEDFTVQTRLIAANLPAALVFDDAPMAAEILATLEDSPDVLEAAAYRADGSLVARYLRSGVPPGLTFAPPADGHRFDATELHIVQPILLEREAVGRLAVRVSLRGFFALAFWFGSGMVGIVALAAFIAFLAGRRLRARMEAAEQEMERQALHDPLTGLANRQAFALALAQTLQRHAREGGGSALLFMDLDGFKPLNDRHGHATGDAVLTALAGRLREALRGADILARIGGDEFAVILTGTVAPDDAARVAEHLIRVAAQPMAAVAADARIGLSIGIALLPADGADADTALRHADLAMYRAKRVGKGGFQFFSPLLDASPEQRQAIETDLRTAIRAGELHLVYQPQRLPQGGRVAGLEALLRWRHAERGIVSPSDFIPLADEAGLAGLVGEAALELACRDIAELRGAGRRVPPVALNLSPRQLDDPELPARAAAALARYGLTPDAIEFELPAPALLSALADRAGALRRLAEAGFRLVLDDFGGGDGDRESWLAALAPLAALPFARLKLDLSLIRRLPESDAAREDVRALADAAHALGLRVVAEGIESGLQAELTAAAGCDLQQGYHLGLPVRKQDILHFLDPL